ncbi:spore germination lipoprotein GerD [Alkalibacillus aidingensis]|uniref:spore germination lipoprotein GerD n=1 Tax=Alkalibacillus aidingensis TaxID=2747607 RepID=UPI001660CC3C|nr:spore germination lipoprotein GerD [Alkalibacillus aidingensis]
MIRQCIIIFMIPVFLLVGCNGGGESQQSQSPDYEQTKKMVVDILKTDDGKSALQEVLKEDEMKQHLVLQSDTIGQAIEEAINSEEGKTFWKDLFEDPEFVQSYIDATEDQSIEIMQGLMHDSSYQEQIITIFNNEDMQKMILKILQSQDYKQHLEQTIEETLNNPRFKAQITEALIKAAQEMDPPQEEQGGAEEQQQDQQGGGNGGGDSGGGGGGA